MSPSTGFKNRDVVFFSEHFFALLYFLAAELVQLLTFLMPNRTTLPHKGKLSILIKTLHISDCFGIKSKMMNIVNIIKPTNLL